MGEQERDEEKAFLVNEVGFTPEQADDATSGDIDRNGAAAMLPGIIAALEDRSPPEHSDDDLVEMGARHVESMHARGGSFAGPHDGGFGSRPQLGLTALKLLQRARAAEQEAKRAMAFGMQENAAALRAYEQVERLHSLARRDTKPANPEQTSPRALAMRIREAAGKAQGRRILLPGVTADDLYHLADALLGYDPDPVVDACGSDTAPLPEKPANPWPLWCVVVRPVLSPDEASFWGPYDTNDEAETRAAELRKEDAEADLPHLAGRVAVRPCRRVRLSEAVPRANHGWWLEHLAERIEEDAGDVPAGFWFDCENEWVRPKKRPDITALDALLEVDVYEPEPDGAAP